MSHIWHPNASLNLLDLSQALVVSRALDLEGRWEGLTALQLARRNGHRRVVDILLVGWGYQCVVSQSLFCQFLLCSRRR